MTAFEVQKVIDKLESNMIRDHLISTDFQSIENKKMNKKRIVTVIIIDIFLLIYFFRFCIGLLAEPGSSLHYYSLNAFYGFGYLGRLWNGIYASGFLATIAHSIVILMNEKRGTLTPIVKLREMYSKLDDPSPQETSSFLYFLKIGLHVRELGIMTILIPMTGFRIVGVIITAYKWNSVGFLIAYIPVLVLFILLQPYPCQTHAFSHLLIAQSTTYFKLRLSRVEKILDKTIKINFRQASETMMKKKLKFTIITAMNKQLRVLEEILNEVRDHNKCIKYWLRDEMIITGCLLSYCLVSIVGGIEWYYKLFTVVSIVSWSGALVPSFINAALLHVRIMSVAKLLHSCQNELSILEKPDVRHKSAPVHFNLIEVVKTKYQILRMIHRVSSPFLRVGYTEGNGESFSPASLGKFTSTVIFTSLMFLNSKSSAMKHLMSM